MSIPCDEKADAAVRINSIQSERLFLLNELAAISAHCDRLRVRIKSIDEQIDAERNYINSYK